MIAAENTEAFSLEEAVTSPRKEQNMEFNNWGLIKEKQEAGIIDSMASFSLLLQIWPCLKVTWKAKNVLCYLQKGALHNCCL